MSESSRELDMLTICDHLVTMTMVRIAELKAKLSEYLHRVRGGQEVTILDRTVPIAKIVPIPSGSAGLGVRVPAPGHTRLQAVALPPPLALGEDIVALLRAERQAHR